MTEVTPAAAPAAPAAAPAVAPPPAVVPVAAPAAVVPPVAPATPPAAVPPAAAPVTPPAAAPVIESLVPAEPAAPVAPSATPQTEAEKIEAARKLIKEADAAADPNSGKAWLLNDGVMGTGEKPGWFKSEKYKTVSAQAEAYVGLEKRFGSFTGAPKNEKGETVYAFTPPEGVDFKSDHPVMAAFTKWATDNQLSQAGYTEILGQLVQYELSQAPSMDKVKSAVGENVDGRIGNASAWVKANLGAEGFALLRDATSTQGVSQDVRIAAAFKLVEAVIGKTAQVKMPRPGNDVPGGNAGDGLVTIQKAHGERNAAGQLRVDAEPSYRLDIEKRYRDYYASAGQQG